MIELRIDDEAWRQALASPETLVRRCFEAARDVEPRLDGEIALLLTSDPQMQALNKNFRAQDLPTNVLSFPSDDESDFLGDIAVAIETCRKEAMQKNLSVADHAAHLIVHGMLHLIGHDHQNDAEANLMEGREAAILARLDVKDPYADALEMLS